MFGIIGKRNYSFNLELEKKLGNEEMINGQGIGIVSQMKYGLCRVSHCGCGCIAVYNALRWQGKKLPLSRVISDLEKHRIFFGILGCNPFALGKALSRYGAAFVRIGRIDDLRSAEAFIISFCIRKGLFSPVHTVFCERCGQGIRVYNRYNSSEKAELYGSAEELIKERRPVTAYILKKQP